jgi:hypothetical protein
MSDEIKQPGVLAAKGEIVSSAADAAREAGHLMPIKDDLTTLRDEINRLINTRPLTLNARNIAMTKASELLYWLSGSHE